MWLMYDSMIVMLLLTLILSFKIENESRENEKEILNEKTNIQASYVWHKVDLLYQMMLGIIS